MIVFAALAVPVGYVCVSARYYRHREEDKENPVGLPVQDSERKRAGQKIVKIGRIRAGRRTVTAGLLILAVLIALPFYIRWTRHGYNLNVEFLHRMQVTAHRGASRYSPENTMASFEGGLDRARCTREQRPADLRDARQQFPEDSRCEQVRVGSDV